GKLLPSAPRLQRDRQLAPVRPVLEHLRDQPRGRPREARQVRHRQKITAFDRGAIDALPSAVEIAGPARALDIQAAELHEVGVGQRLHLHGYRRCRSIVRRLPAIGRGIVAGRNPQHAHDLRVDGADCSAGDAVQVHAWNAIDAISMVLAPLEDVTRPVSSSASGWPGTRPVPVTLNVFVPCTAVIVWAALTVSAVSTPATSVYPATDNVQLAPVRVPVPRMMLFTSTGIFAPAW